MPWQEPGDEALDTVHVTLSPGSGAWSVNATFPTGEPDTTYALSRRFENLGEGALALEAGHVTNANISPSDPSWYAYGSEPGGQVEITASDETGSGHFSRDATLDLLGPFEEPTSETVVIRALAFNGAPIAESR